MRNPIQAMIENQVASFQEDLAKALEELQSAEILGSSGGGAVEIRMTGGGNVLDVRIDPAVVDQEDVELLQDLVCTAIRDALAKSSNLKREKILAATPLANLGVDLPDIF